MAHEILHCVFGHHTRRGNRDKKIWNIACDLAINILLIEYGFQLPSGAYLDYSLKGLTAEQIYDIIVNDKNGYGKYKGMPDPDADENSGGLGSVSDATDENGDPASDAERSYQETDWKISATQASNLAEKAGKLPAGMSRMIKEHIDPVLPWRDLLLRFVDKNCYNDYSWLPPNRKFINSGFYFPSVRSKELERLFVMGDASGSVRDRELGYLSSEIGYVMNEFHCGLTLGWFDTEVHTVHEFEAGDVIDFLPKGGGGTDFKAPFRWLEDNGIVPRFLIIFTDLDCCSYPEEPYYPVLWITWKRGARKPPFGEVIEL